MSTLKRLIIVAIILIIIGLVGSLFTIKSIFDRVEFVTDEQIVNDSYHNVHVNVENMSVKLYVTNERETKIVTSTTDKNKTITKINDDTLTITVDESTSPRLTFPNFGSSSAVPTLTVYLPKDKYKLINVKSKNGMITAGNIEAEELSVKTVNGLVWLESIQSNITKVLTENGMINLSYIKGDIKSETKNGKISYEAENIDQNIDFKTVNGLISIQTEDEPTNVTFDISVELGKVDLFGSNSQNAVYGEGEHLIKLTTSLGKVTVYK